MSTAGRIIDDTTAEYNVKLGMQPIEYGKVEISDFERKYYLIMDLLRNTRMKHGKCLPRADLACTHCNAVDEINRLIDEYKGAPIVASGR